MKKLFSSLIASLYLITVVAQLPNISLVQVVGTGLSSPIGLTNCGDNRLFVIEQAGRIKIVSKSGVITSTPFLDISANVLSSGNEQGLLALTFSPDYKQDGFFYVNYIYDNNTSAGITRISRFSVNPADSNLALANSEQVLLQFTQPYTNHNGASLFFGSDGYLYDAQGDGGSQYDPQHNGQNKNVYLAKILRLDVSNPDTTYTIPPSNPFVGMANAKGEVWDYGLRNPWRCTADRITGDIWIGDVGQGVWEEIDFHAANDTGGLNFGWSCKEGNSNCSSCSQTGCTGFYTAPVFQYNHSYNSSCSVTGGYVYRGAQYSKLWGLYLFTDYCNGIFFSVKRTAPTTFDTDTLNDLTNGQFTSFGEGNYGELYVCYRGTGSGGRIYRITETTNCNPVAFITMKDSLDGCAPFTLSALLGDTLSYQWYNSGGLINGATSYQYSPPSDGWYKVKVSKTSNSNCQNMSDSVYVTLHLPSSVSPCNCTIKYCSDNEAGQSLDSYISPTGGIFSGSGISNNSFVPYSAGSGTHNITYIYTNNFNCISEVTFPVVVNDTTPLSIPNPNLLFCVEDTGVSINGIITPEGGIFKSVLVDNDTMFHPSQATPGTVLIPYLYENNDYCISTLNIPVEIGAVTDLTVDTASKTTNDCDAPFSLENFVVPAGGTYSGNGVSSNVFTPGVNVQGSNTITYTYTNSFGCVSAETVTVNVGICTEVKEITSGVSFSIFPNPNKGVFKVRIENRELQQYELQISDEHGRIVYSKNISTKNTEIELPQLAKGIYTARLKSGQGSCVKRLVIE